MVESAGTLIASASGSAAQLLIAAGGGPFAALGAEALPTDSVLTELGVPITLVATTAGVTHPTVQKFMRQKGTLRVSNLAAIVRALRKLTGVSVRAADLCDVGE